jgi:hypothetical protein
VAARELAQTPLPPDMTFEESLQDPDVRARVYDPGKLVIFLDDLGGQSLNDHFATLPVVNQQLRSLMIFDEIGGRRVLRYPGAVVSGAEGASPYTVYVPLIESRGADGVETIRWLPVVEEIEPADSAHPDSDPFRLSSGKRGLVCVRINYPFQAAAMTAYQVAPQQADPPKNVPISARDDQVTAPPVPGGGSLVAPDGPFGTYAGAYGLGRQAAHADEVRPFRRLLSAQAIFRREVFR